MSRTRRPGLELWGGVECTVNRVAGEFRDQLRYSGHHDRLDDLDAVAALGIRALRFPVLWERVAPQGLRDADWSWTDTRLDRLRALGVRPIAGLLHHGSGPPSTSLLDDRFPDALEEYAAAVAERYPWIEDYTPINEPVTTARFSALYGHWYPHRRDSRAFALALRNQIEGTRRAMLAIRRVNPNARLVQTDDAGRVYGRPAVAYQAQFDSRRNGLTWDLLTGRVRLGHPLFRWLADMLGSAQWLETLAMRPCPPDVIGLNYYVTSDRVLDERLHLHPPQTHGGNGRHAYADIDAVRARPSVVGHFRVLMDAWRSYRLPIALTEVHLGCTREEQLRWLAAGWRAARSAARRGVDVRAVTVWALFGSHDWNSLVTRVDGCYEPGAFDVRSSPPRPTALAKLARSLAATGHPDAPLALQPGWWSRRRKPSGRPAPLLIAGAGGTLGRALVAACRVRGLHAIATSRADLDVTDSAAIARALDALAPWAVIDATGYVRVDDAERDVASCEAVNARAAAALASHCAARGIRSVVFSSDLVFDGRAGRPYLEADPVAPLCVYGASKAAMEEQVLAGCPRALVIRTSAFFGPADDCNFVTVMLRHLAAGQRFAAADDTRVSPTYVPDLVNATLDLLIDGETGIWHLASAGEVTWLEFAQRAAALANADVGLLDGAPMHTLAGPARRPRYSVLASSRGALMPPLDATLARYFIDRAAVELINGRAARDGRLAPHNADVAPRREPARGAA